MRIIEVIESKAWKNKRTGATVSIYGAVPYFSEAEKADWEVVTRGFTWRSSDGTIGLGRAPAATRDEAEAVMNRINAV